MSIKLKFLALIISFLTLSGCREESPLADCFPVSTIHVRLFLNDPLYQNLTLPNGWVYVSEQQSGTKGLIVVNSPQGYRVYDRNAPHLCPEAETTLRVEANSVIVCPKDGAKWNLFTGEPLSGNSIVPKIYRSQFDASNNTLILFN